VKLLKNFVKLKEFFVNTCLLVTVFKVRMIWEVPYSKVVVDTG